MFPDIPIFEKIGYLPRRSLIFLRSSTSHEHFFSAPIEGVPAFDLS